MSEEKNPKPYTLEIHYRRPPLYKKVFSRLFDLLLMVFVGLAFFLLTRLTVLSFPYFQKASALVQNSRTESGLYEEKDKEMVLITKIYPQDNTLSPKEEMEKYETHIQMFFTYAEKHASSGDYQRVQKEYDTYRLGQSYLDVAYFIRDENQKVIKNPDFDFDSPYTLYSNDIYKPYIADVLTGYLSTLFPDLLNAQKSLTRAVIFLEVPMALVLAGLLVYLLPGFIFRRERKSIGMLIYHIGMADSHLLHVKTGRYLAYIAIKVIAIYGLSFYTLGIPLLIDVSLLAFSHKKQDFGMYMLGLNEIDISNSRIYYSKAEIAQEEAKSKEISKNFKSL